MDFELIPEDDGFKKKTRKTHIDPSEISIKAASHPWQGQYDRRKTPRDVDIDFSVPVMAYNKSDSNNK